MATIRYSRSRRGRSSADDRVRPNPSARIHGPARARSGRAAGIAEASVRLSVTLATERQESRRPTQQPLPLCPGDEHSGAADGPVSSTVSQAQPNCKQKSSDVNVDDQTAASGARQRRGPRDQAACSECREPAPSKRPDYCSPTGGGIDLVAGVAAESEDQYHRSAGTGRAIRRIRRARLDHQDRLQVRAADPRRGRLALRPSTEDRPHALRAPAGAARPHRADRATRSAPPPPHSQADARTQEARQRDHGRVRPRARLLPLGSRDRPIASPDSPRSGAAGAGPRSPLARAELLWAALTTPRPLLDTRPPATKPGTWGSQPPHMRLTRRRALRPTPATPEHPNQNPNRSNEEGKHERCSLDNRPSI